MILKLLKELEEREFVIDVRLYNFNMGNKMFCGKCGTENPDSAMYCQNN